MRSWHYDNSFKLEDLEFSDEIGIRKAAEQLDIPYYILGDWRSIRKNQGDLYFAGSSYKCNPSDEKERQRMELESERLRQADWVITRRRNIQHRNNINKYMRDLMSRILKPKLRSVVFLESRVKTIRYMMIRANTKKRIQLLS